MERQLSALKDRMETGGDILGGFFWPTVDKIRCHWAQVPSRVQLPRISGVVALGRALRDAGYQMPSKVFTPLGKRKSRRTAYGISSVHINEKEDHPVEATCSGRIDLDDDPNVGIIITGLYTDEFKAAIKKAFWFYRDHYCSEDITEYLKKELEPMAVKLRKGAAMYYVPQEQYGDAVKLFGELDKIPGFKGEIITLYDSPGGTNASAILRQAQESLLHDAQTLASELDAIERSIRDKKRVQEGTLKRRIEAIKTLETKAALVERALQKDLEGVDKVFSQVVERAYGLLTKVRTTK